MTLSLSTEFVENYGNTFRDTYNAAYQRVEEREDEKIRTGQRKDFHFLSASLTAFMPWIPVAEYEAIYRRILTNHVLSARNFSYVDLGSMNHMQVEGNTEFLRPQAKQPPRIFCTYHLGGYRAVMMLLLKGGYSHSIVVNAQIFHAQKAQIDGTVQAWNEYNGTNLTVNLLDAESSDIGKQMAMTLISGRSILIFPDGNTGVGGVYHRNARQLKVPFLNQRIYSRTGIATLSHTMRIPITPIICHYVEADGIQLPVFHCVDPIDPRTLGLPAELYVRQATTQLYAILADHLSRYIDQWESWFYIHKFLDTDELIAQAPPALNGPADEADELVFDHGRFGLFKLNQDGYLFDKQTYQSYPLTDPVYAWLTAVGESEPGTQAHARLRAEQPAELLNRLYRLRVLTVPSLAQQH
jgi:lauroyl/myristoyl acyltransferase